MANEFAAEQSGCTSRRRSPTSEINRAFDRITFIPLSSPRICNLNSFPRSRGQRLIPSASHRRGKSIVLARGARNPLRKIVNRRQINRRSVRPKSSANERNVRSIISANGNSRPINRFIDKLVEAEKNAYFTKAPLISHSFTLRRAKLRPFVRCDVINVQSRLC